MKASKEPSLVDAVVIGIDQKYKQVHIHRRLEAHWMASFVMDLVKLGMHQTIPDGETTGGHQRFRPATTQEVVQEAMAIADETLVEIRKRGWVVEVPPFDDLLENNIDHAGFIRKTG